MRTAYNIFVVIVSLCMLEAWYDLNVENKTLEESKQDRSVFAELLDDAVVTVENAVTKAKELSQYQ